MEVRPTRTASVVFASRPSRKSSARSPAISRLIIEVKALHAQWALRRVLERFKAAGRCIVASFETGSLGAFSEPPFTCGASRREVVELMARTLVGMASPRARYRAICPPTEYYGLPVPMGLILRGARRLGAPVHVWTVDAGTKARRLWRQGVNGIISERAAPHPGGAT